MPDKLPEEFLAKLRAVSAMRPKRVIDHILKHGHVTTRELRELYDYEHAPRAARDVRELGIHLETFRVTSPGTKKKIAAYRFDPLGTASAAHSGRTAFPKAFKKTLITKYGCNCALCNGTFISGFLQIDHRIPYQVGGQSPGVLNPDDYMLVCRTCNRGKSWACEHCPNWLVDKKPETCLTCFWANPTEYTHIATLGTRRLNLVWTEEEVSQYDQLAKFATDDDTPIPEYVKEIIRDFCK
jgi:5-methylcytosine-specific restriction endonuclease McrA